MTTDRSAMPGQLVGHLIWLSWLVTGLLLPSAVLADFAEEIRNIPYHDIYPQSAQLSDGRYEGAPFVEGGASRPTLVLIDELTRYGDLNEDGIDDAAVVLVENSGGSGNFFYLAVILQRQEGAVNEATTLLGDRVQVRSLRIGDARIHVNTVAHGPCDLPAQPTWVRNIHYRLGRTGLSTDKVESSGCGSLGELRDTQWRLVQLGEDQPGDPDIPVTLVFSEGKIAGSSGCNRYSASVREDDEPGELVIGPTMSTRMACPGPRMQLESDFLSRLGRVRAFSREADHLRLDYHLDGVEDFLLFVPDQGTD